MNTFFVVVMIGISLSMDAFSLALGYGMYGFSFFKQICLAFLVGIFHFFMPLLGMMVGCLVYDYFIWNFQLVVGIVFFVIGLQMVVSGFKDIEINPFLGMFSYFLFGFSVSIDSFTTGIGMRYIDNNYLGVSLVFMVCSGLFTYLGLCLGGILSRRFGNWATVLGGVILLLFSFYYVFS